MLTEEKEKLNRLSKEIYYSIDALDLYVLEKNIIDLDQEQQNPKNYNDFEKIKTLKKKISQLKKIVHPWLSLKNSLLDLKTLIEMAEEEESDQHDDEIKELLNQIEIEYNKLEIIRMFQDEADPLNCYLSIHSGAGGTEACDWVAMLYRMYCRWIEEKKFSYSVIEYLAGEEAGIKSVTLFIKGDFAYGLLKAEVGVHRLVRISPFDSNKRRHTSFASVSCTAEVAEDQDIEIKPNEVRIDTYRSSGAGGQHVNTTDSAVRLTHLATSISVTCQAERSQLQNKESAFKLLKAKLFEHYKEQEEEKLSLQQVSKKKIEWGSQIRSYVFHPYNMIKDHRTLHESSNIEAIMNGDIDPFINSFLKKGKTL